mmetsp:Transcript_24438/g.70113  ORF Transcript_24438/g.70113 Transcript_24438/m.70113 type:complete len:222 (+) Transcript_24438:494-1159(+)
MVRFSKCMVAGVLRRYIKPVLSMKPWASSGSSPWCLPKNSWLRYHGHSDLSWTQSTTAMMSACGYRITVDLTGSCRRKASASMCRVSETASFLAHSCISSCESGAEGSPVCSSSSPFLVTSLASTDMAASGLGIAFVMQDLQTLAMRVKRLSKIVKTFTGLFSVSSSPSAALLSSPTAVPLAAGLRGSPPAPGRAAAQAVALRRSARPWQPILRRPRSSRP